MGSIPGALFVTFLLNLPFGYWRKATRKMSKEWFLAVHTPVPAVFLVRLFSGASIFHVPLFVISFFFGQFLGGKTRSVLERKLDDLSKCMFVDVAKVIVRGAARSS